MSGFANLPIAARRTGAAEAQRALAARNRTLAGNGAGFSQLLAAQQSRLAPLARTNPNAVPLRLPNDLGPLVAEAARRYGVDQTLIAAVIESESSFNPAAVSPAGARGLMQLMPATARGLGVTDPSDPVQNVMGGTKLLRELLERYNGDARLALAAYNAGGGAVDKYGGIPPYPETQRYVPKVLAAAERYRQQPLAAAGQRWNG